MKRLFLFSGSLDSFSQVEIKTLPGIHVIHSDTPAPDTSRATLIVYYDRGPAIVHTKPGFVVRQFDKDDVYLDDRKRVIKGLEVWGYKIKK